MRDNRRGMSSTALMTGVVVLSATMLGFPVLIGFVSSKIEGLGLVIHGLSMCWSLAWLLSSRAPFRLSLEDVMVIALVAVRFFTLLLRSLLAVGDESLENALAFSTIGVCWFVGRTIATSSKLLRSFPRAIASLSALGMIAACAVISRTSLVTIVGPYSESARLALFGTDPITTGRTCGAAVVIATTILTQGDVNASRRYFGWLFVLVALWGLILSGTRGPVIAAIVAVGAVLVTSGARLGAILFVAVGLIGSLTVLGAQSIVVGALPRWIRDRFILGFFTSESSWARLDLVGCAIRLLVQEPIVGPGLSRFSAVCGAEYSHSLFLDIVLDTGLLGTIVLGIFLFCVLLQLIRSRRSAAWVEYGMPLRMLLGLAMYYLTAAQFSASYSGNAQVWLALGVFHGGLHQWAKGQR